MKRLKIPSSLTATRMPNCPLNLSRCLKLCRNRFESRFCRGKVTSRNAGIPILCLLPLVSNRASGLEVRRRLMSPCIHCNDRERSGASLDDDEGEMNSPPESSANSAERPQCATGQRRGTSASVSGGRPVRTATGRLAFVRWPVPPAAVSIGRPVTRRRRRRPRLAPPSRRLRTT
jgi:hypothetical protein